VGCVAAGGRKAGFRRFEVGGKRIEQVGEDKLEDSAKCERETETRGAYP